MSGIGEYLDKKNVKILVQYIHGVIESSLNYFSFENVKIINVLLYHKNIDGVLKL